jgi:hypothetical protein
LSFADLRYSDGGVYEKNGFVNIAMVPVDYKYIVNGKTVHKSSFTKDKIRRKFGETGGTEREMMARLGFLRIYDCGKIKYEWKA